MIRLLYLVFFKAAGWKVKGAFPKDKKKYIAAVAPHTSNWDFMVGVMVRSILHMKKASFRAKSQLFKPPFGWFFRLMGGKPVDRSHKTDRVQQVVDLINAHEYFILGIAPEGTRKKVEKLKTGFYYIAKGTNIPIVPCGFDYPSRTVIIGDPLYPGEDSEADINQLVKFYRSISGFHPACGL